MSRRLLLIVLCVFAALFVGVVLLQQPPPSEALTVRFHSIGTNGTQRVAYCAVSNATSRHFMVVTYTEYMTNGAFARDPSLRLYGQEWSRREHGVLFAEVGPGSNRCRFVAQYFQAPTTRIGKI